MIAIQIHISQEFDRKFTYQILQCEYTKGWLFRNIKMAFSLVMTSSSLVSLGTFYGVLGLRGRCCPGERCRFLMINDLWSLHYLQVFPQGKHVYLIRNTERLAQVNCTGTNAPFAQFYFRFLPPGFPLAKPLGGLVSL